MRDSLETYRAELIGNGFSEEEAQHQVDMARRNRERSEHAAAARQARMDQETESLRQVDPSRTWAINPHGLDVFGMRGAIVQQSDGGVGLIPASARLAAIVEENARFESLSSAELFQMSPAERPVFRGTAFGVVDHPEHGRLAVTPAEFKALGLPEVTHIFSGEEPESPAP